METLDKYGSPASEDDLGRALGWFCGVAPLIGFVVTGVSLLDDFRRRAIQALILSVAGAIWWYLILFVRRLGVPDAFPPVLVILGLLLTPLFIISLLRRSSWPDLQRGDDKEWRRHLFLSLSALFLLLTLLISALWFSILRPETGRITWGNSSVFETIEIDSRGKGADQLLLAGYCCLTDIDIDLLGFRILFGDQWNCLWNIKIPFWFLASFTVIASIVFYLAREKTVAELFGRSAPPDTSDQLRGAA